MSLFVPCSLFLAFFLVFEGVTKKQDHRPRSERASVVPITFVGIDL